MHMAHTVTTLVLLSFTTIYFQGSSTNVDRYIFCKQWFPRKWDLLIILRPWDSLVSVKVSLNAYWLLTWSWCIKRMIIRSLCVQAGDLLKRHVCCYFTSAVILRLLLFYICCYFTSAVIWCLLLFMLFLGLFKTYQIKIYKFIPKLIWWPRFITLPMEKSHGLVNTSNKPWRILIGLEIVYLLFCQMVSEECRTIVNSDRLQELDKVCVNMDSNR